MLIIAGHLVVNPGERGAYLVAANEVTALARSAAGCLDFVQTADPLLDDRILVFERWESPEQLMAFRNSDPDAAPRPDILGADVKRYEISAIMEP